MIHTSLINRYIILRKTLLAIMSLYTCILQELRSCPCKIKTIALHNWLVLLVMQIVLYCMYEQLFFPNNVMINPPNCFNSWFMCSNLHSISFECLYKILIAPEWSNLSSFSLWSISLAPYISMKAMRIQDLISFQTIQLPLKPTRRNV